MRNFLVCFILLIIFGTVTHAVKRQCQVDDGKFVFLLKLKLKLKF